MKLTDLKILLPHAIYPKGTAMTSPKGFKTRFDQEIWVMTSEDMEKFKDAIGELIKDL